MIGLGLPYIRGYKPYGNYQDELEDEITRRVNPQLLTALRVTQTPATAVPSLRRTEPPPLPRQKRRGSRLDYGLLQEENRRRGTLGEQLVVRSSSGSSVKAANSRSPIASGGSPETTAMALDTTSSPSTPTAASGTSKSRPPLSARKHRSISRPRSWSSHEATRSPSRYTASTTCWTTRASTC